MAEHYSITTLIRHAWKKHQFWQPAWRDALPKKNYDIVIVGGGGHGLATAFYLAQQHGIRNVAVLEKNAIGMGNAGRNTTIVRSNYMMADNAPFYEFSMKLWRELSYTLNYNVMFSPRGYLFLACSPGALDAQVRRANIMRLHGVPCEILTLSDVKKLAPYLDFRVDARFPIHGAMLQNNAGTARHDAVVWGYARAASALGVDIVQNCEVDDFLYAGERIVGVKTNQGDIGAHKVALATAGATTKLTQKAGLIVPIETYMLQAYVSEAIKPLVHHVVVWSGAFIYVSQSDKGGLVFGGHLDKYTSWAQRGNLTNVCEVHQDLIAAIPAASKLRLLRHWGGLNDMTPDASPYICKTEVDGLYLNAGWCYGGFKATPASGYTFAHLLALDNDHPLAQGFRLDRFKEGRQIDESGAGPYYHLQ